MFGLGTAELSILVPLLAVTGIVPTICFWRILGRAGFNRWWSLLAVCPPLMLILLLGVAFVPWPAQK